MEETIEQLEKMLETRQEQCQIISLAGGHCNTCEPDIKALESAIQVLKEQKVYTKSDVIEMLKSFVQEFKEIHDSAYNIYLKYKHIPGLGKELFKHLGMIYDKEIVVQIDVNIEASDNESNNASI